MAERATAIVGGGVVGLACADELARAGRRVILVEKGRVGGGCSHGNCGYVCPSHVLPHAGPGAVWNTLKTLVQRNSPLKVRPGTVLANPGWFLGFARRCNERDMLAAAAGIQALLNSSRALYDELLARESIDCEWEEKGLLFAFQTKAAFEHYAQVDALLRDRFDMPAERWDAAELLEREPALKPDAVAGGYLYRSDAQLRPDKLVHGWRTVVEKVGVSLREGHEFQGFVERNGKAVAAKTSHGDVEADEFVVATGAWTPKLAASLGCKVPIQPGKGYSITMPRPKLCPTFPIIFEEHRVAVSPFPSGYRIGSTMEFAGYDDTMNRKRLKLLLDGAAVYLKEPTADGPREEWWGWRPMVYDGKPIVDFSPKLSNVLIAAGHGMLGLSMAPATGKLAKERLAGEPPHVDPKAYSLTRF